MTFSGEKIDIVFFPHYSGSYSYFEKLAAALPTEFRSSFVLAAPTQEAQAELKQLSVRSAYPAVALSVFSVTRWFPIPSVSSAISHFFSVLGLAFYFLLRMPRRTILVAPSDQGYFHPFLRALRFLGFRVFVLQWAHFHHPLVRERMNRELSEKDLAPENPPGRGIVERFLRAVRWHPGELPVFGMRESDRVGVFSESVAEILREYGVRPEKIRVLPSFEVWRAQERASRGVTRPSTSEIRVLVLGSPFYTKDIRVWTISEQVEFYRKLTALIQKAFGKDGVQVALKLHPAEDIAVYEKAGIPGMKFLPRETDPVDAIAGSDLVLSHFSTLLPVVRTLGKPMIAMNFTGLKFMTECIPQFGNWEIRSDWEEVESDLVRFHSGKSSELTGGPALRYADPVGTFVREVKSLSDGGER